MRHKHADLIYKWADGAEIEIRRNKDEPWEKTEAPEWFYAFEYRVKPEPKPDVVGHYYASIYSVSPAVHFNRTSNLKLTFDTDTCELKSAEVLK
jgi:hypothetical protein